MDPVTLRTDRLVLSVPEPSDAEDVIAYANDPDVVAYTPVPVPYGHAEAHNWITDVVRAGWSTDSRYEFGIRRADDLRLLGTIGLFGFVDGAAEVGYAVHPDGRGHGFVTEAAAAVLAWAFTPSSDGLGLVRVQWRAIAANAPSAAIAQRLGLRYEGRLRSGVFHRGRRHDQLIAAALHDDDRSTPTVWPAS
ncbi:RimJ/RimL family protein N-acetyltransferase [Curtobacterium sp. PhB172]|uniref:GNAT family N-acetyltransferase n=1 Tax=unclassified Curtobacterium TaxID=257496 RepID=UPI000F49F51F|nr:MULTISPECIES: GNAT family protein [unclassified Curtobacterium]ROQ07154.1 RimJ/RimL family protein N-acetyltransferase [Curtobacterium sp. PhB171]ROQ28080.1 RimJ/RimL family protein N-acetyltransferase [Curtobacterium sp. PhB170]ROS35010.1 RimJ/RimL family protein N-acetyltransferase [Curtobacterium sp. PhB131]ROS64125.1 RimJ/RimL family protein N-acetyltransferase [Curtobacterium sp. PhB172]ROS72623.1 RimJ/RimL family protein N-acetyltransferase [Curtobacterium sp. PhB141]